MFLLARSTVGKTMYLYSRVCSRSTSDSLKRQITKQLIYPISQNHATSSRSAIPNKFKNKNPLSTLQFEDDLHRWFPQLYFDLNKGQNSIETLNDPFFPPLGQPLSPQIINTIEDVALPFLTANPKVTSTLLDKLVTHLQKQNYTETSVRLMNKLINKGWKPSRQILFQALSDATRNNLPVSAISVYHIILSRTDIYQDSVAFTLFFNFLISQNKLPLAEEMLEQLLAHSVYFPTRKMFTVYMKTIIQRGDLTKMRLWYNRMCSTKCPPDDLTYSALIRALLEKNKTTEALRMLEASRDNMNIQHINSCLLHFQKVKDHLHFWKVFDILRESNLEWSNVTYGLVLGVLAREGRMEEIKPILKDMHEKRIPLNQSHHVILNELITSFSGLHLAMEYLDHWIQPIELETKHINVMISGFARFQMYPEAIKIFSRIQESELTPDPCSYTLLMDIFQRYGKWERVIELWGELESKAGWPSILIDRGEKAILPEEVRKSPKTILSSKLMRPPLISVFLDACGFQNKTPFAKALMEQILHHQYLDYDDNITASYLEAMWRNNQTQESLQEISRFSDMYQLVIGQKSFNYILRFYSSF